MLTKKQHELLTFIHARVAATGIAPSFEEMKEALSLRSKSGIHRLILGLEERGFIRRLPHRARAIELTRLPDGTRSANANAPGSTDDQPRSPANAPTAPTPLVEVTPRPAANRSSVRIVGAPMSDGEALSLPLYGRIAAGTPIEALRDVDSYIDVPSAMVGAGGDHYALQVEGDSMIEAGILDGDVVIVRRTATADNGAIVVALIEDHEATLKRLRRRGGSIALEPANKAFETRIYRPDQIEVQGQLIALYRQY